MKIIQSSIDTSEAFITNILNKNTKKKLNIETITEKIALELKIEHEIYGAITGKIMNETLHINGFAVLEKFRGRGFGTQLISAIEKEGLARGAKKITVHTQCYQALTFYKSHGYQVFGQLEDVPFKGTTKYYLFKDCAVADDAL